MSSFSVESRSLEQTIAIGAAVAASCGAGDVIALNGELGAGKTQFVRGLAQGLGIDPRQVSSPTFVIAHEYEAAGKGLVLAHLDAYRLGGRDELRSLGFADEAESDLRDGAVMAVEWADRVAAALPADRLIVLIEHTDVGRVLTFTGLGSWGARMIALRQSVMRAVGS